MEGGHDTFFPPREEEGELHLHMAVVGGSCRGKFCQDEMVGLDGWVQQQMKEGEELLVPLLERGTLTQDDYNPQHECCIIIRCTHIIL